MVIFLAPYHLANSQAFSVSTSCLHSGITKHDTHQERKKNVHPYIPLVEHRRDFTLVTLKNLQRPVVLGFSHMCVLWFQFFFKSFTGLSLSVFMWRTKARQHSGSGALLITSEPATQSGLVYHITYINQLCGPFGTAHSEMNFIRIWRLLFGLLCSGHLETQQWSDDSR